MLRIERARASKSTSASSRTRRGSRIEDASEHSGNLRFLAALNGTASGGGYELALACDKILLVDDRSSAVSFPELPLLGVLPGTGGLTRISDHRQAQDPPRPLTDVFSTVAEGIKGKRAVEVEPGRPPGRAAVEVGRGRATRWRANWRTSVPARSEEAGVTLDTARRHVRGGRDRMRLSLHVTLDPRRARTRVAEPADRRCPKRAAPKTADEAHAAGRRLVDASACSASWTTRSCTCASTSYRRHGARHASRGHRRSRGRPAGDGRRCSSPAELRLRPRGAPLREARPEAARPDREERVRRVADEGTAFAGTMLELALGGGPHLRPERPRARR